MRSEKKYAALVSKLRSLADAGKSLPLLLFLLLPAVGANGQTTSGTTGSTLAPLPNLQAAASWAPESVPFSFVYEGKASSQLLTKWTFSHEPRDPTTGIERYTYCDPTTHLRVIAEVRTYADLPGTTDWVIHFVNDGPIDTPILENILPLDWGFPSTGKIFIRHARGSNANAEDFRPLEEHYWPQGHIHMESVSGVSSSGDTLPFFNLDAGGHGYVGAIGWSGDWKADFDYNKAENMAMMHAGMKKTHLVLHPHEEIRTPRIVLMGWTELNWQDAQNDWRQLLFAHYTPHDHGKPMVGPVLFGSWGGEPIADKLAFIDWVHQHQMPVNLYAADAGWFGASFGLEGDPTNPWWKNRGDWFPSPLYYPHGIKPLGEALKSADIGFSLWIEPEASIIGKKIYAEHPDWFLTVENPLFNNGSPSPNTAILNLGNPAALKGITDLVSGLITDFGMTWYRQDFNETIAPFWEKGDTPDRIGATEIHHIEGLYAFWDALLAQHPGLHIDNCAGGGRRLDIEMMSRSFSVWRTDNGFSNTLAEQAQTQALAYWVPETMGFGTFTSARPWEKPGPYDTPEARYLMRLGYSMGYGLTAGTTGLNNEAWITWMKQTVAEYREVQPYFSGDFYPLLGYSLNPDDWTAWQWNRPGSNDGLVMIMRRPDSPFSTMNLSLRHLNEDAMYEVEMRSSLEHSPVKLMKGADLSRYVVTSSRAPDSVLIFYKKQSSTVRR